MDDLLEQFGELVFDIARDMQNNGYFTGSQELGEAYQTFLHDVLRRRLRKAQLPRALYKLTQIVAQLTKRRPIVLIDKYDTPTSYAVQNNYFPDVCPWAYLSTCGF
jgi:hypothetical protein